MPPSMLFGPPFLLACCGSFLYPGDWGSPGEGNGVVAILPTTTAVPETTSAPRTVPYSTTAPLPASEDIVVETSEESVRISNYDRLYARRDGALPRLSDARDDPDAHTTSRPDAASEEGQEGGPSSPSPDTSKDALSAQQEEEQEEEEAAPAASRGGRAGPDALIRVPSRGVNGFARSRNLVRIHVLEGGLPRGFERGPEPDAARPGARRQRAEAQEGAEDGPATEASSAREGGGGEEALP